MENAIEVTGIGKRYKSFALRDVTFSLPAGQVMGFIGPNGAGKTTTIRILLGLARADSGSASLLGLDPWRDAPKLHERLGFVQDEACLNGELNTKELGWICRGLYASWDGERYRAHLSRFGLLEKQRIKEYSKGMKVKLLLAMALSHGAELILMDEPTSGLDPVFRSEFLDELFSYIQDENRSVFFSTHITADLERVADRVTFINAGQIVFSKTRDEIRDSYRLVRGPAERLDEALTQRFIGLRRAATSFNGLSDSPEWLDPALVSEPASLEDIMVYTTREDYRV
jgi:ABC-2 type transport system ATP-binding protein